jgi:hypothetical protein
MPKDAWKIAPPKVSMAWWLVKCVYRGPHHILEGYRFHSMVQVWAIPLETDIFSLESWSDV